MLRRAGRARAHAKLGRAAVAGRTTDSARPLGAAGLEVDMIAMPAAIGEARRRRSGSLGRPERQGRRDPPLSFLLRPAWASGRWPRSFDLEPRITKTLQSRRLRAARARLAGCASAPREIARARLSTAASTAHFSPASSERDQRRLVAGDRSERGHCPVHQPPRSWSRQAAKRNRPGLRGEAMAGCAPGAGNRFARR